MPKVAKTGHGATGSKKRSPRLEAMASAKAMAEMPEMALEAAPKKKLKVNAAAPLDCSARWLP